MSHALAHGRNRGYIRPITELLPISVPEDIIVSQPSVSQDNNVPFINLFHFCFIDTGVYYGERGHWIVWKYDASYAGSFVLKVKTWLRAILKFCYGTMHPEIEHRRSPNIADAHRLRGPYARYFKLRRGGPMDSCPWPLISRQCLS